MLSVVADIEPTQSGSGTPSPDNVRPIYGHTEEVVEQRGRNLLSPKLYSGGTYNPSVGVTFDLVEASTQFVTTDNETFTLTPPSSWSYFTLILPVQQDKLYTLTMQGSSTGNMGRTTGYLDKDFKVLSKTNDTNSSWNYSVNLEPHLDANRAYYYIVLTPRSSADAVITITKPMVRFTGTDDTSYEPYHGHTYTTQFGQTVYGGSVDLVSGVLTVDRAMDTVDTSRISNNGTLPYGGLQTLYNPLTAKKYGTQAEPYHGLLSNRFNPNSASLVGEVNGRPTNGNIYFNMPSSVTTIELARQWFTDNPTQIVYELATPQTYQLTPQEIDSFKGQNNLWASTGEIEVEYRADIGLYVNKMLG